MAAVAAPGIFPDKQAIINYINAHPYKQEVLNDPTVASITPNGAKLVSEFFAGKTLARNTIESNVRKLLVEDIALVASPDLEISNAFKEVKDLARRTIFAEEHADKLGRIDKHAEKEPRELVKSLKEGNKLFELPVILYTHILNDLLDKIPYTKEGKNWTKQVADLTKEKS